MKKAIFSITALVLLFLSYPCQAFAVYYWAEQYPNAIASNKWNIIATSSNGQTVIAGMLNDAGGRLYLSTNAGSSWTETQPKGNSTGSWQAVSMSADGQRILVAEYSGRMYLSTNSGTSWSETQPAGNTVQNWYSIAMSDDGQKVLAASYQQRIYISSNGGTSWSETQPAGNTDYNWYVVNVSGDGQTLYAGGNSKRLFRSTNSGVSWAETQPAGNTDQDWRAIATSYDGQTTYAAPNSGGTLYKTTNQGTSWTAVKPAGNATIYTTSISMNSAQSTIFVTGENRQLFLSYDSGATWSEDALKSTAEFGWEMGVMSRDGTHLYAGEWPGRLMHAGMTAPASVTVNTVPTISHDPPRCGMNAPTNSPDLFQIDVSGTDATLYFAPANQADRYYISYGNGQNTMQYGTETVTGIKNGVVSYDIHALSPNSTYTFIVRGGNGCATGNWGNTLTIKTTKNRGTVKKFYRKI